MTRNWGRTHQSDSDLYTKGEILFGLAQAKKSIRDNKYAVIVEGNIDVLMMHQSGFTMTVAPMGTALTPMQVRLLRRFTDEVVLLYDGDAGTSGRNQEYSTFAGSGYSWADCCAARGSGPGYVHPGIGSRGTRRVDSGRTTSDGVLDRRSQFRNGLTDRGRARTLKEMQPLVQKIRIFGRSNWLLPVFRAH